MKIKHLIMTRWWMIPSWINPNILDDKCMEKRLDYLVNNLFSTLENQTNKEFEFILQMHPEHTEQQIKRVEQKISSIKPSFEWSVKKMDDDFYEYVRSFWDENDIVVQTRIDDDDFVNRNAVQDTRDITGNGQFDMILSGYHYGHKYFEGTNIVQSMKYSYQEGHMSIFQSLITNTKRVEFSKYTSPYSFSHTTIRKELNDLGYNIWFVAFDRPDGYLWFRHPDAVSYKSCRKSEEPIQLSDEDKRRMKITFGIDIQ